MQVRKHARSGFTLVELLLVMAILALISIVAITQFTDAEGQSRQTVSKFNAKSLQNTTENFKSLHGVYPQKWHTGFDTSASVSVEGLGLQAALNMAVDGSGNIASTAIANTFDKGYQVTTPGANVKALSLPQARALRENGIHELVAGGYRPVTAPGDQSATGVYVTDNDQTSPVQATCWVLTGGKNLYRGGTAVYNTATWSTDYALPTGDPVKFKDRELSTYQYPSMSGDPEKAEAVVLVFCAKEVDWASVLKGDPNAAGWGELLKQSSLNFPEPPKDPNAKAASAFPYYIAVFWLSPDQIGSNAGFSCKLLGILDQDLNSVRE